MDVQSFRAGSMQDALKLVRKHLGPDAAVVHTREVPGGPLRRLFGKPLIEIYATRYITPPRRSARRAPVIERMALRPAEAHGVDLAAMPIEPEERVLASVPKRERRPMQTPLSESLFRVFADLIETGMEEEHARVLIERLREEIPTADVTDAAVLKARLARLLESEIRVTGPIQTLPGRRRLVALIGPTGVGKTTTIAKLAAHYRLKERKRVGLITLDTFRIAAIEQLRAYADIIDLPMEVVSNPAEMRHAVARLADLDLVLMDTAGRSPRDEVKLQELKAMFAEAAPDETHLVLSATCGAANLVNLAKRFSEVGVTALLLSKLDETHGIGNLLPLIQSCQAPLSYVTTGQNVPDDIEVADPGRLARTMIGAQG